MTSNIRLNLFERAIAASLTRDFQFAPDDARALVIRYVHVIRKLGGYDNVADHAERLVQAHEAGYSAHEWLERIRAIEREERRDKGIPDREHGPQYVHM